MSYWRPCILFSRQQGTIKDFFKRETVLYQRYAFWSLNMELVLIPMNLSFGRISRGKCTVESERWHSGEELELETMINILGVNRDKDKCKTH